MTRSPTRRLMLAFAAAALVLCIYSANDNSQSPSTAGHGIAVLISEAELSDHITVPFFSFAGLTSKPSSPAL